MLGKFKLLESDLIAHQDCTKPNMPKVILALSAYQNPEILLGVEYIFLFLFQFNYIKNLS